jgi:hypothetical protein
MRLQRSAVFFVLFAATAFGQSDKGAIQGTVSDPVGAAQANAPVQAKNAESGKIYKATSTATGSYSLTDLPAGKYDVTVAIGGLKGFARNGVGVEAAKMQKLDIRLEEGTQLSTLGEDALGIAADAKKHAPPAGPAPRMGDGKPDLSGTWWSPRTVDPGNFRRRQPGFPPDLSRRAHSPERSDAGLVWTQRRTLGRRYAGDRSRRF